MNSANPHLEAIRTAPSKLTGADSINSKARRSIIECDSLFFCFSSFWKLLFNQSSAEAKTTWNWSSLISLSYSLVLRFSNLNRRNAQLWHSFIWSSTMLFKGETTRTEQMIRTEKPEMKCLINKKFFEPIRETIKTSSPVRIAFTATFCSGCRDIAINPIIFFLSCCSGRSCREEKPLTAISGTDQSLLCVAWRTRLIFKTIGCLQVPIFLASLVFPA